MSELFNEKLRNRAPDVVEGAIKTVSGESENDYQWAIFWAEDGLVWSRYHVKNTGGDSNDLDVAVRGFIDLDADPEEDEPQFEDDATGEDALSDGGTHGDHVDELVGLLAVGVRSETADAPTSFKVDLAARRL